MTQMTPEELRSCIDLIGWGQRELARRIESHESSIRQMARGTRDIPDELAIWLRTLASVHQALPKPLNWGSRRAAVDQEN